MTDIVNFKWQSKPDRQTSERLARQKSKDLLDLMRIRYQRGDDTASIKATLENGEYIEQSAVEIGIAVNFTFKEYMQMGASPLRKGHPRMITPHDVPDEKRIAYLADIRRPKMAAAARAKRAAKTEHINVIKNAPSRAVALRGALNGKGFFNMEDIMDMVRFSPAFMTIHTDASLRETIRREFRKRELAPFVEETVIRPPLRSMRQKKLPPGVTFYRLKNP
jgi:hypothetical protein